MNTPRPPEYRVEDGKAYRYIETPHMLPGGCIVTTMVREPVVGLVEIMESLGMADHPEQADQ